MMLQSVERSMTIPIMTNYKAIETAMFSLIARSLGIPARLISTEYDRTHCGVCGSQIPPGKAGRKCKACRKEMIHVD